VRWRGVGGLLAALLLACSSGGAKSPPDVAAGESSTTASTSITTTTPPAQPVTIAFAGDITFEGAMRTRLARDPQTAIGPFADVLTAADVAVGNLETALGTGGTPENKQYTYQAPRSAIDALRAGGFDVVSMANNHGRDFGPDGLEESLAIKDVQPDHFIIGIGHNDTDAYAPYTVSVRGQRIAVIGATQVLDEELVTAWTATPTNPGLASAKRVDALVAAVQQARANADTVVVFLHWGVELEGCPIERQQVLAQQLADAGADIVVGGHAHRLLGAGMLGTTFVGYGLGNFDFAAFSAVTRKTGVIQVTVTGRHIDKYEFIPGIIEGAVATPLDGADAQAAVEEWNTLRPCTGLN
jgi:poly-gamma-glutamate capsule biosynthesis protein CapA/YwtB (metallophosphatase superfamily)